MNICFSSEGFSSRKIYLAWKQISSPSDDLPTGSWNGIHQVWRIECAQNESSRRLCEWRPTNHHLQMFYCVEFIAWTFTFLHNQTSSCKLWNYFRFRLMAGKIEIISHSCRLSHFLWKKNIVLDTSLISMLVITRAFLFSYWFMRHLISGLHFIGPLNRTAPLITSTFTIHKASAPEGFWKCFQSHSVNTNHTARMNMNLSTIALWEGQTYFGDLNNHII